MTYRCKGDLERVRLPRAGERPIWQHTCWELFFGRQGGAGAYREYNFAPSGEWAAYAFYSYRKAAPVKMPDPRVTVLSGGPMLAIEAMVPVDGGPLRVGLSAVIESEEGLSYWALRHPAGKPDFHHADAFALELA